MKFGSVCSGIEAASVAWEPLGWKPQFFAEIEKFPSAVLAHHWPRVPNYGDFTQIKKSPETEIDLLVGGTPCQAFSVAGQRAGLEDPRGNLTLEFLRLAQRLQPRWLIWENVPGVLSIDRGRTFGAVLGTMAKLGYGFAYRVLDAQHFGVPQRRRRVFLVGCLGDWQAAREVLFERTTGTQRVRARHAAGSSCSHTLSTEPTGSMEVFDQVARIGRRYTPLETERLQGFPDRHTLVPYRGEMAKDTPRYKATGNSMAVPVMRWLGRRIAETEEKRCMIPTALAA